MGWASVSTAWAQSSSNTPDEPERSAPANHKLIVCQSGTVQGWGGNNQGQLGFNPSLGTYVATPQVISTLSNVVAAEVGGNTSFVIKQDGSLWAWGNNLYGQLGLGYIPLTSNQNVFAPTLVTGITNVVAVAAAGNVTFALRCDGTVWSWGSYQAGLLGDGSMADRGIPQQIPGLANIAAISCGTGHCFARASTGLVYTWGANSTGQLGLGLNPAALYIQPTPVLIPGLTNVRQIEASNVSSIAVTWSGAVYCWGSRSMGRIGDGGSIAGTQNAPVLVPGVPTAVAVASSQFSNLAVEASGQTWSWGDNTLGTFGICSPSTSNVPLAGAAFPAGTEVVSTGYLLTAIETNGTVKTWGGLPLGYTSGATTSCLPTALITCPARLSIAPPAPVALSPTTDLPICSVGGVTQLTASGGLGGNTYTWSPATGLSSTTGGVVAAAPCQTTTYTVTSGCQSASYTVVVNLSADCCELNRMQGHYTVLPANQLITTNPFTKPPGTYYYVRGTLRLANNNFVMPAGSVLLVGDGQSSNVELGTDAYLEMPNATITAACGDMWGGLIVAGDAGGISTYTNQGGPCLRPRLQHSYEGLVLEEPSANHKPYFSLDVVQFHHNRHSVTIRRGFTPPNGIDFITNCSFDSNPLLFKSPWNNQGYYSEWHIGLRGDVRAAVINSNDFQHTLYGVTSLREDPRPSVNLSENTFSEFYLAGVFDKDGGGEAYGLQENRFTFPRGSQLPQTRQVSEAMDAQNGLFSFPDGPTEGTYGVLLNGTKLNANGNRFQQLDSASVNLSSYDNFATARPRQTGILTVSPATINNNLFYLLDTGIKFQGVLQETQYEVKGNGFTNNRLGIGIQHSTVDYQYPISAYYPNPPQPALKDAAINLSCNTFRRIDQRTGTSIGVHIPYQVVSDIFSSHCFCTNPGGFNPGVLIDNPNAVSAGRPNTTYMKNWFDDSNAGNPGYVAFQNDQSLPFVLEYLTLGVDNPLGSVPVNWGLHDATLSATSMGQNHIVGGDAPNNNNPASATCQNLTPAYNAGLQFRGAAGTGHTASTPSNALAQNWPNPATGTTSFAYHLKSGTQRAELLIRRASDGRETQRLPLNSQGSSCEVKVGQWPKGTYFATLVVEGMPGATRRVVVE